MRPLFRPSPPGVRNPSRLRFVARAAALATVLALAASASEAPPPGSGSAPRGAQLAAVGGCQGCHSAPGRAPFAGGVPFRSPFGVVWSTNITPDARDGIGRWTQSQFVRAMRQGVGPGGRRDYPAFPYDHFRLASDGELADLWAWTRALPPVASRPPANRLVPPLGLRPLMALWQALAPRQAPTPTPPGDTDLARGARLVAGLGHCGACHTHRNLLQMETTSRPLAGGMVEGWYAPPLQGASPAPVAWTAQDLETYLRTGFSARHQAAGGPMGEVTRGLAGASPRDLHDMAAYLAFSMRSAPHPAPVDRAALAARLEPEGAQLWSGACAQCHEAGSGMSLAGRPSLALGTPPDETRPTDVVRIVLDGLSPPAGAAGPYMPPFAASLTDVQVARITAYVRARYSAGAPWKDLDRAVAAARRPS